MNAEHGVMWVPLTDSMTVCLFSRFPEGNADRYLGRVLYRKGKWRVLIGFEDQDVEMDDKKEAMAVCMALARMS
ncbi:hypothetical protein [Paraburkholderia unamae]|uniref:Uncharacterized protein n=1 Tax=Paraburkholderia unamae TaxID=219649 RepID=A0ACC6RGR6_9BURK